MITIINRQRKIEIDTEWLKKIAQRALNAVNYSDFDLGILITNNAGIRKYNRTYRNKDKPTDILSFAFHSNLKPGERIRVESEEDKNLGDLILSMEYIKKAADSLNVSLEERLTTLIIHGICHLLGYDHETDSDWHSMRAKEASIQKKIAHTDASL